MRTPIGHNSTFWEDGYAAAYQGNIPVYLDNKNAAGDQLFILINPALSCEKINGIVKKFNIEVIA